ncbi:MAG: NTP transferase domain-containing protein [Akkermansiaceae bacterium]|nr:NTP transferase domain-containing protein [Akkermansiaceae bacterium]
MLSPTTAPNGLVLAGGRSSRMGTDKAALVHPDGRPLARRCHDLLLDAGCHRVALSLRHDQEIPPGFDDLPEPLIVRDPQEGSQGPLSGILAAIARDPAAAWLVLATDLPRLDSLTLTHLMAALLPDEPFLAYRSEFDGLPEPLCALYTPAAIPILRAALAADLRCPRKILIRHHCRLLDPVSARALDNANTPADWAAAHPHPAVMSSYHIHYFGLLADRRGLADEMVSLSASTPTGLLAALCTSHPLGISPSSLRVAVNDELVPWDYPLHDGDHIALLPPMSGG